MMEGATTLADSLLDDLDDISDVEEEPVVEKNEETENKAEQAEANEAVPPASEMPAKPADAAATKPRRKRLVNDASLQAHLQAVRKSSSSETAGTNGGWKQHEEEEHRLVVESNKHLSNLSDELARAHAELCAAYHDHFPEVEELIVDPVQYKNAVRVIWNEMDVTKVNDELNKILNSNQIITITVAGSTTSGRPLTPEELQNVEEAAIYMEQVMEVQKELTSFVESRMESLAPSTCALIGPATAAKLLGLAGGLAELSKIPACNLQVLGQVRHSAASRAGFSSLAIKTHTGILAECDLVQRCPSYLQRKALKVVAAKLALAARCDFVNVDTGRPRSAESGRKFRTEIETKITKWEEPDKTRVVKALPKPDLTIKKRRGGKRIRRLKEKFEETEMMKQANTRAFSSQSGEYGDDAMGLTMGMLDTTEGGGNIRRTTEKRKMRQANTKASRKRAIQMSAGAASGLASSMVFTPVQGLELVNPDANKERVREANSKWFGDKAGFQSALPKNK